MSSLFGSKQKSSSTTTTTPYSGDYTGWVNDVKNQLWNKNSSPVTAYTGNLSAGSNSNLNTSRDLYKNLATNKTLTGYANGDYLNPTSNPYLMSSYNLGADSIMKNFNKLNDATNSQFNNSLFNSSMRQNQINQNKTDTEDKLNDYTTNFMNTAYNTGVNNMTSANGVLQSAINGLNTSGTQQQATEQNSLDNNYKEWLRQQGVSDSNMNNILQLLALVKNPSTTTNATQSTGGLFNK